ncbi:DUF5828 family protein [Salinirubellus salinus]|jgi:hypothetical protein|uniref:DUF5828 family protein n=1 Tax=Salinirubellus salinus TaxID=1364945 RepID=A0A9E7UAE3_9EURY|nr:DUF5828 family protein [Salinirubellus salinus]UWM54168.1 DUF5828 family protein [Salinirubellus salinus]
MEESVAGFKERGSWVDIVEHGERVTRALKDVAEEAEVPDGPLAEWDEWRPKVEERLDEDVSEKTAEKAAVAEGEGEKAGKAPDEDVQTAGEKLSESYEHLDEPDKAVEEAKESIEHLKRAVDSAGRKAIRKVEGAVYKSVMTQVSPYYFDNELVSANLRRAGQDDYVFEVNVNDDDLKIRVSNALADLEQTVDRWHVDTEKDTEAVEVAEGVPDATEEAGTDGRSRPHTN